MCERKEKHGEDGLLTLQNTHLLLTTHSVQPVQFFFSFNEKAFVFLQTRLRFNNDRYFCNEKLTEAMDVHCFSPSYTGKGKSF